MRKDFECTFWILKGQWQILRTGIYTHSIPSVDFNCLTCCALHSMLLVVDGIDEPWVGTKIPSSSWEREIGQLEGGNVPLALRRLVTSGAICSYDGSAVGVRLNRVRKIWKRTTYKIPMKATRTKTRTTTVWTMHLRRIALMTRCVWLDT